jgi:hypothetical protein
MAEKEMRNFALGHEEGACIHRREGAGGQAQGRAGLDGRQDLEAAGQKGGRREAGRGLKIAPIKSADFKSHPFSIFFRSQRAARQSKTSCGEITTS